MEVEIDQYPVVNYWYKEEPWKQPSRRELRLMLLKFNHQCYWGCGTVLTDNVPKPGESAPDDLATIDHIVELPKRGKGGVVQKVLACYKCNQKRSIKQNPNNREYRK